MQKSPIEWNDKFNDIEDVIDEDGKQFRAVITNEEPVHAEDPAYVLGADGKNAIQRAEEAREQAAMDYLEGNRPSGQLPAAPALLPPGYLWFDDSKRPTSEKVAEAAAYHRAKGRTITLCVCNPRDYQDTPIPDLTLVARYSINPSNFWLGELDELEEPT